MSDKYIMVSLDDKKSKDIANVLSNDTSRKLLDYLSDHDKVAPVDLSKKLNIPISTVTYNLKHLRENGLIESKDFAWSDKGKKVELYSLARKLILIAPKGYNWKESLKKILPVALVGLVGTALLKILSPIDFLKETSSVMVLEEAAEEAVFDSAMAAATTTQSAWYPYWLFFLVFICIVIVTVLVLDYRRQKK